MAQQQRMAWVDAAKGISITLVVMMYAAYSVGEDTGGIGILHAIIGFATPFRMPEFFLISGLFLNKVIDRNWTRYADRRALHYIYFYLLWMLIHILVKTVLAQGAPLEALNLALVSVVEPYGVLWFVYVLAMTSLATKALHSLKVPLWAGFALAALLQIAPVQTGWYAIDQFAAYFVFFYTGYAIAPFVFKLVDWAMANRLAALGAVALWAIVNAALVFSPGYRFEPNHFEMGLAGLPLVHLALAIAGALALCVMAGLLVGLPKMNWLSWMGSKSLIIYLAFALPMSASRIVLIKLGLDQNIDVLSLAVFFIALISPLVLYAAIKLTGWGNFLFERPAWAHIPGTPGSRSFVERPATAPAE